MKKILPLFSIGLLLITLGAGCTSSEPESSYETEDAFELPHELNEAEGEVIESDYETHEAGESTDDTDEPESEPETGTVETSWKTYSNPTYGYSVMYPSGWFYTPDACCPPPPTYVMFNNVSSTFFEYTAKQLEPASCNFQVLCLYEGALDDIGELQARVADGETYAEVSINGYPAAQVSDGTYYVVDGTNGCRINSMGSCNEISTMLNSFSF